MRVVEIHHSSGSPTDVTPSVVLFVSPVEAAAYVKEDFWWWEFGQLVFDVEMGYAGGNRLQTETGLEFLNPTQSFLNVVSSVHLAV